MRTLNRNRQLLWFTLLAGLVLAGNAIGQGALGYITWTLLSSEAEWLVLNFIIEFFTLFLLVFLLAGIVHSISSKKDGPALFFEGLCGAKKYTKTIVAWSGILALTGMLIFSIYFYSPDWLPPDHPFLQILGTLFGTILNPLMEFPFNPTLTPYTFFDPSRVGGIPLAFWVYPSGIMQALIFSEVNLLLFILTPFVVPFIVLEKKTLREAVAGSFNLMKKTWDEVVACAVFLGVIVFCAFLTYQLVQAASGIVSPFNTVTFPPPVTWITLALIYNLALITIAFVVATVAGIAMLDLYTSAKSRQVAVESTEPAGVVI